MIGKRYSVALVGAGRMGERWAKVIARSPRASLSVIIDAEASRASRLARHFGASYSANLADAFSLSPDVVCIATPHKFLYPIATRALSAGAHVFVEKPGSKTSREMRRLVALAKKKRRVLMVGFNYRFFDSLQKAKEILALGKIGRALSVRITHGHPGRAGYEREWRMNKDLAGGGVLMDQGVHLIDLARWFLDEPVVRVSASLSNRAWRTSVEDSAGMLLETKTKRAALLSMSIAEWRPVFSCEILGENGYILIPGLGRKYGDGRHMTVGVFDRKTHILKERTLLCDPDAERALAREFSAFMGAVARGGYRELQAEAAVETLRIVEEIYAKE